MSKHNGTGEAPDHGLRVYADITQLVSSPENPTPLVKLNRSNPAREFPVYLKLERYNPFGSVKDRIVAEMLAGLDRDSQTVIEPSSGNTGIALVGMANALGIPAEIAVPKRIPEEKKVMLKFLGAKVVEADDALCPLFPSEGARGLVNAMIKSPATKDSYVSPNQYENELNVRAHYRTTGPEIWKQTKGQVTHFFAGLGTGGTISGVGRFLKEQNPAIKVIAIEPAAAEHKLPGLKRITGLDEEFIPKILDRSVIDGVIGVSDSDAYETAVRLARKDGIMVGPTTGAIVFAALRSGKSARGLAVAISPDDAFKYASFYKDYLETSAQRPSREFDLAGLVCPLSRIKAAELLDSLREGETVRLVLGDVDSVRSVAQEIKQRSLKPDYRQEDSRHVFTVKK
ncbi:MAG: pyridoxal-phosphate dependent enzyme [Chloroflexi bacterium]|nr:pyridoxal-phosphate dependent enzyme [Chloroflexota bacterium]